MVSIIANNTTLNELEACFINGNYKTSRNCVLFHLMGDRPLTKNEIRAHGIIL